MWRAFFVCFVLLTTVALSSNEPDITIGMSAAFTGPSRGLGIELYRGTAAFLEEVNRNGGVHGRKIALKLYDDRYDPVLCIENTIKLVEQDRVLLLANYVGTPTVTRILPLLKRYPDLYLFFPFTGASPQRQPPYSANVFNLRASYREETAGLVDHFLRLGRRRIGVFYQIDAYGRSGWDGVRRALASHNLKIVSEATYRRGSTFEESMNAQVEILRQGNPDAVISVGSYAACAAFIRDARDSDWNVPIANVSFVGSENLLNVLMEAGKSNGKDYTANLVNSQVVPSYHDVSLPAVREYRELMDRYNPSAPSSVANETYTPLRYSFVSLEGFMNAKLLVEVLRRMPSELRREQIKQTVEAIGEIDLGIRAPAIFSAERHQALETIYYTTVEKESFVPINSWEKWRR